MTPGSEPAATTGDSEPTRIKICGVTRPDDAARVAAAGIEFIGLNFWPTSKRYLAPEHAPAIAAAARAAGATQLIGVFVDARLDHIAAIARDLRLDGIQLHGDETPEFAAAVAQRTGCPVWKAIALGGPDDLARLHGWSVDAILLDAPTPGRGGAGQVFDWRLAAQARSVHPGRRLLLAGGLGPDNVRAAIDAVAPWAVDVASGVESAPGVKDPARLAAFVAAVRS
ncbi:MAG: phosphoribosylanthranilate isomerase [Deltaproteobacteria bacterium]|nr:MAG: phosphoribosylanthranilate isomerase [Deltaproteobacteria bacterium]TMQ19839.1 MAG: phosphoribosylanthranilate isomerase [Deltaproteobacteria bacterium]